MGICGDDCETCPRFHAMASGSEEQLAEVARLWLRLGFRDRLVTNEEIECYGCRPDNNYAYREQRDCAFARRLTSCGPCDDYLCKHVERTLHKEPLSSWL